MPEILVQLVDEHPDPLLQNAHSWDLQMPKRGDVLTVHEYAGQWGKFFTDNQEEGRWIIVSVACTVAQAVQWMTSQMKLNDDGSESSTDTLLFRDRGLYVSVLRPDMTYEQLQAITFFKPKIDDPDVLGDP